MRRAFAVGLLVASCAVPPGPGRTCAVVAVENRAYADHVVYVQGERIGTVVGLSKARLRACRPTRGGGVEIRVRPIAGRAYGVGYPQSWDGEGIRLIIGHVPAFTEAWPLKP